MINGLSKWTKGAGKAIDYFLGDTYFDKELEEWKPRDPAPVILEGDPQAIKFICDSLDFKNQYTTGVLSFNLGETAKIAANPELKDQILQDFKDFAFAGVPESARQFLAIEHTHTGRLEIHYMLPRVHLESGKYRNPFPPNYNGRRGKGNNSAFIQENDSYIDHACNKFGLTNPRDPAVARDLKISGFDKEAATKKEIHGLVCDLVDSGHVTCREDIQNFLVELGGKITRNGDDYLSVKFGDNKKAIRLKGDIYDKAYFGAKGISESQVHEKARAQAGSIEQRFKDVMAVRTQETQRRHNSKESGDQEIARGDIEFDESELELESEFNELIAVYEEFENSTDDLPGVKSAAADFACSNSSQIADYKAAVADIGTGVDVGDLSTIDTDDPVIRFFQNQFKQQLQKEMQRAQAASKRLWSTPAVAAKSDELLAERVGIIFKAAFGISCGVDIDRPGRAYTRTQLHQDTAKAAEFTRQRALLLETERKQMIQAAAASQAEAIQEQKDQAEQRGKEDRARQRLPTWKRNGQSLAVEEGYKPRGR
ncbi:relaxase/mobilization nuclease domain-containing protein [Pseudomonas sp. 165]|uniref:relaxase/mobilization nuclease domain-containing protein n=1 Tax=Pseudomonas sp. 165 TaxID=2746722 RepID=UPI0025769809|nr:relaxase/mobilization nuclease domain-containing protein [Pseudomonas sp. 165]MDM1709584.1 relaxase/mobilization nuclease domain-containing protein [Pseudomonas sp. 165]